MDIIVDDATSQNDLACSPPVGSQKNGPDGGTQRGAICE